VRGTPRAVESVTAIGDQSLARCISDIRLALHDRGQRIIRTLPRHRSERPAAALVRECRWNWGSGHHRSGLV